MNFRRTIALLSAGIMAAGVMAGTGITTMAAEKITDAQAKEIALADAGLTADQVTFDRVEMGTEQGASVYEIEFRTGSMEYDYDVAVSDGEIVEESWEIRRPSASGSQISEAEAKNIAVKDAGVSEADVTFIKTESGDEDGIPVYEIEFEDQNTKFDYDVAKAGGSILHASRKVKVPACVAAARKASANADTGRTGEEAAIEAALSHAGFTADDVTGLEHDIDRASEGLPKWQGFTLPGGCREAAIAHVCRTVCRRAERRILTLNADEPVDSQLIAYINRLSDYFYILALRLNFFQGTDEILWQK